MAVKKLRKHSSFVVYSYCSKQGMRKEYHLSIEDNMKRYLFSKKYYIINLIL